MCLTAQHTQTHAGKYTALTLTQPHNELTPSNSTRLPRWLMYQLQLINKESAHLLLLTLCRHGLVLLTHCRAVVDLHPLTQQWRQYAITFHITYPSLSGNRFHEVAVRDIQSWYIEHSWTSGSSTPRALAHINSALAANICVCLVLSLPGFVLRNPWHFPSDF